MIFNVFDWYWFVGGDAAHVWSSARQLTVSSTDSTYIGWRDAGNITKSIASYSDLYGVLLSRAPMIAASVAPEWVNDGFLSPQQVLEYRISIGLGIMSTGAPALNAAYDITPASQLKISGIITGINAGRGIPGGGSTFAWQDMQSIPHEFTAEQYTDFAAAVETYMYGLYITEAVLLNGGSANWPEASATIP